MIRVDLDRLHYSQYFYEIFQKEKPTLDSGFFLSDWLYKKVIKSDMFKWCSENTEGNWEFVIHNSSAVQFHFDTFYFCFEAVNDAVAFKMRWI